MVPAPPGAKTMPAGGDGEQPVFADAVGEVLRDVRGELADRLALDTHVGMARLSPPGAKRSRIATATSR
jgi:hypothetical protein